MDDAHVPNSEATPGWKNHKFARTNFLDAIITTPLEDFGGSRYAGNAPVDWCSGAGSRGKLPVLGGYLGAVLINAACQFSRVKFDTRAEHDPLSLYIEFLQPVRQGPYHVALSILQSSASQATIKAEIVSADSAKNIIYCHATIRVGSLSRGKTLLEQSINQRKVVVPDRIKDCSRWVDAFFYYINPPSTTVRCYTPSGGPTALWSPAFGGQNVRYMWNKLDNEQTYELEYLPLLVDLVRMNRLPWADIPNIFAVLYYHHNTSTFSYLDLYKPQSE
ncbi:hypothetical protein V8C43DRAFT_320550 [Trichoderma afarasin]